MHHVTIVTRGEHDAYSIAKDVVDDHRHSVCVRILAWRILDWSFIWSCWCVVSRVYNS